MTNETSISYADVVEAIREKRLWQAFDNARGDADAVAINFTSQKNSRDWTKNHGTNLLTEGVVEKIAGPRPGSGRGF